MKTELPAPEGSRPSMREEAEPVAEDAESAASPSPDKGPVGLPPQSGIKATARAAATANEPNAAALAYLRPYCSGACLRLPKEERLPCTDAPRRPSADARESRTAAQSPSGSASS